MDSAQHNAIVSFLWGIADDVLRAVYEELLRRFSEENNEEAGEHFTPRDVVHLMGGLILLPIKKQITSGTYLLYDPTCGTGGMLTEADFMLRQIADELGKDVSIHLYGQEVNPETFAICKADLLIKGEDEGNIAFGSTLSADAFPRLQFNFMAANPPYGKSWKTDLDRLCGGDKGEMRDPRFVLSHDGNNEFSLVTRSSDDQIDQITRTFLDFKQTEQSKIFDNADFGYWQITVERPLRLATDLAGEPLKRFKAACKEADDEPLAKLVDRVAKALGAGPHLDFNQVRATVQSEAAKTSMKLNPKRVRLFREQLCRRDETAAPVVKEMWVPELAGNFDFRQARLGGDFLVDGTFYRHEPDPDLRDHENVPLKETVGDYFQREVIPHVPDAWVDTEKTVKGYEISFTKYFYRYEPLRELDAIAADLLKLEGETEGLLHRILEPGRAK